MYIDRYLQLKPLLQKKSFFLMGPRATGKTSLIKQQFADQALIINLLRSDIYLRLSAKPWELESLISNRSAQQQIIVIDEIQRVPELLNEVHRLIEEQQLTFLLTGSSARKLKKQNINLLAGRAWEADLFPLTTTEITDFDLERYLLFGGIPSVYLSEYPREELIAYVDTYLREEIQAESLIRKLQSFTRFLQTSALTSGNILNFNRLSNDVGIPASTVREYYQILQDTLLGFLVPAWTKSKKRKALSSAKFYFFDIGVRNQLVNISALEPHSDLYGQAFEQFIAMELRAYISYRRLHESLSYWCTKHGNEVDFIMGDHTAIEVKVSDAINARHLKGLKQLQEEKICQQYFLISHDKTNRVVDNINIIYWQDFLKALWAGEYHSSAEI
ncbi:MAG: ATP-binding protein [Coxiellaceae bacterium]|nr:ATP-binding protein [Coxiellaceae bacterium]